MKTKQSQLEEVTNLIIERLETTDNLKEVSEVAETMIKQCGNPSCSFCNELKLFLALPETE